MASINPGTHTHTHTEHVERRYQVSSPADAEGTVASSSKINEPFRRSVRCRTRLHALREWRIPLLMTDGRAITGMTADSRARPPARSPPIFPAFFSPGISIFPDRTTTASRWWFSKSNARRTPVVEISFLFRPRKRPRRCSFHRAFTIPARPCLRAFGFLHFSQLVSLTTGRLSLSLFLPLLIFSARLPLCLSFPCFFFFSPSDRPHRRRVALSSGYSTFGNTYLHREVVCARASRGVTVLNFNF